MHVEESAKQHIACQVIGPQMSDARFKELTDETPMRRRALWSSSCCKRMPREARALPVAPRRGSLRTPI